MSLLKDHHENNSLKCPKCNLVVAKETFYIKRAIAKCKHGDECGLK